MKSDQPVAPPAHEAAVAGHPPNEAIHSVAATDGIVNQDDITHLVRAEFVQGGVIEESPIVAPESVRNHRGNQVFTALRCCGAGLNIAVDAPQAFGGFGELPNSIDGG
jgi:hypothetical protein